MRTWMLALLFSLLACDSNDTSTLDVTVLSDFLPGTEAVRIQTRIFRASDNELVAHSERSLQRGDAFVRGLAAAHLALTHDDYSLRVVLLNSFEQQLISREVRFAFSADTTLRVPIMVDCANVQCPNAAGPTLSACLRGTCVDPRCTPDTREYCPENLFCDNNSECSSSSMCATSACTGGLCVFTPITDACEDGQHCALGQMCAPDDPTTPARDPRCDTVCTFDEAPCRYGHYACEGSMITCVPFVHSEPGTPCGDQRACDDRGECVATASIDAGMDASTLDASMDAAHDAGRDGSLDAARDAAQDAIPDAVVDLPSDAPRDMSSDAFNPRAIYVELTSVLSEFDPSFPTVVSVRPFYAITSPTCLDVELTGDTSRVRYEAPSTPLCFDASDWSTPKTFNLYSIDNDIVDFDGHINVRVFGSSGSLLGISYVGNWLVLDDDGVQRMSRNVSYTSGHRTDLPYSNSAVDVTESGRYVVFGTYDDTLLERGCSTQMLARFDRMRGLSNGVAWGYKGPGDVGFQCPNGYVYGGQFIENDDDSGIGHDIVFTSDASNHVAPGSDTNGVADVFVWRRDDSTEIVSVSTTGELGNGESQLAAATKDGRYIVFASRATNLTSASDTNGTWDLFLRDRVMMTTTLVTKNRTGGAAGCAYAGSYTSITDDGATIFLADAGDYPLDGPSVRGMVRYSTATQTFGFVDGLAVYHDTVNGRDVQPRAVVSPDGSRWVWVTNTETTTDQTAYVYDPMASSSTALLTVSLGTHVSPPSILPMFVMNTDGSVILAQYYGVFPGDTDDDVAGAAVLDAHRMPEQIVPRYRSDCGSPYGYGTRFRITRNGRFVVFVSDEDCLVPDGHDVERSYPDVFVWKRD